jgi:hypothetical protein
MRAGLGDIIDTLAEAMCSWSCSVSVDKLPQPPAAPEAVNSQIGTCVGHIGTRFARLLADL